MVLSGTLQDTKRAMLCEVPGPVHTVAAAPPLGTPVTKCATVLSDSLAS